jgi:2-polyprenyl-3-methyl-5-hydroxy-6-metoxy-1,4-benzoquinol methylase
VCTGTKITRRHERQVSPSLDGIRSDHKQRYFFASELISGKSRVSDVACGIGYGSYIIAKASPDRTVYAVDLDAGAIEYAIQNYSLPNIDYICNDVRTIDRQIGPLDAVISFETIEHIPNPRPLLVWASEILKKDGVLICSTPNEDKLKFTKAGFPYHEKHYTPYEFEALLTEAGFKITGRYTQHDRETGELVEGWDGLYNIAICTPA